MRQRPMNLRELKRELNEIPPQYGDMAVVTARQGSSLHYGVLTVTVPLDQTLVILELSPVPEKRRIDNGE